MCRYYRKWKKGDKLFLKYCFYNHGHAKTAPFNAFAAVFHLVIANIRLIIVNGTQVEANMLNKRQDIFVLYNCEVRG